MAGQFVSGRDEAAQIIQQEKSPTLESWRPGRETRNKWQGIPRSSSSFRRQHCERGKSSKVTIRWVRRTPHSELAGTPLATALLRYPLKPIALVRRALGCNGLPICLQETLAAAVHVMPGAVARQPSRSLFSSSWFS